MTTGLKTSLYSENVADHLFFIFTVLNEIAVTRMDLASFLELQTARTQKIALLIDTDIPTMDVNRTFQQSTIYHFLPLMDGTFAARYYRRAVPVGTLANVVFLDAEEAAVVTGGFIEVGIINRAWH